jgi:hypothetical protein
MRTGVKQSAQGSNDPGGRHSRTWAFVLKGLLAGAGAGVLVPVLLFLVATYFKGTEVGYHVGWLVMATMAPGAALCHWVGLKPNGPVGFACAYLFADLVLGSVLGFLACSSLVLVRLSVEAVVDWMFKGPG